MEGVDQAGKLIVTVPNGSKWVRHYFALADIDITDIYGEAQQVGALRLEDAKFEVYSDGQAVVWVRGVPFNVKLIESGVAKPDPTPRQILLTLLLRRTTGASQKGRPLEIYLLWRISMKRSLKLLVLLALSQQALAMGPQWTWEAGKQTNNGAITVKSTNGSTTYAGTQNPTGAVAKVNQNAVTQPPTVIVQATASLPIKVAGDPCTASTSGSSPQMADEGTAILADRSLLLTCQSGSWQSASGGGKTGQQGLFYPLRGKTISCDMSIASGVATVDSAGTLTLGVIYHNGVAPWTYCTAGGSKCYWYGNGGPASSSWYAYTEMTSAGIDVYFYQSSVLFHACSANWPLT